MTDDKTLPRDVEIRAFGQKLRLRAPRVAFLRQDSLWRLRTHYQTALAARSLAPMGRALDIGAGFGAFAIPFAMAYPGWTVLAFEPDRASFMALRNNVIALGLTNVVPIPLAITPEDLPVEDPEALLAALKTFRSEDDWPEMLRALAPLAPFARHKADYGYMQPGPAPSKDFQSRKFPSLPAKLLARLEPELLKLTAPQCETKVLEALKEAPLDHLLGERWSHVDSTMALGEARPGERHAWLPLAGTDLLVLRNQPEPRRRGVDVVIAMYNSAPFIEACIRPLLEVREAPLRVIVVDDGSTDDSAEIVRRLFGDHPAVTLHSKPNGGCASARNYGRMMSDATHIAFIDADDIPDPGLFPDLYELARQTGAEVVQGGFHFLDEGPEGLVRRESVENGDPLVHHAHRHRMGELTCHLLPNWFLLPAQPTIWRRVYRRDYLDNRRIWFPEHIRAFDDQVFQFLTLQPIANIPMLDGRSYGYRQHPGQDIKQKDERHFYSLEMFRMALKRGLAEGWQDFRPLLRGFVHTVNWVTADLRPDLIDRFREGAAEFWAMVDKIFGPRIMAEHPDRDFHDPILLDRMRHHKAVWDELPRGSAYAVLDSVLWQAPMVRGPWDAPWGDAPEAPDPDLTPPA
jgi:glycosyltransferase involved in cell wall biosynthesis